ncbi:MAG TPA: hypothetical protein VJH55_00150 [Candidatus Paceibacterota bacterium]
MENPNSKNTVVWVIVIIVILVLGTWFVVRYNRNKTVAPSTETETTLDSVRNNLTVKDQFPGDIVFVSDLALNRPAFVVIHKENAGAPGAIIGTALFDTASTTGQVKLTEKTVNGKTYYAVLYGDNGNKTFTAGDDLPLTDTDGATVIMKTFKATTDLEDSKG